MPRSEQDCKNSEFCNCPRCQRRSREIDPKNKGVTTRSSKLNRGSSPSPQSPSEDSTKN